MTTSWKSLNKPSIFVCPVIRNCQLFWEFPVVPKPMETTCESGSMSMWASTADTLVAYKSEGSACKFADRLMGGLKAVSW